METRKKGRKPKNIISKNKLGTNNDKIIQNMIIKVKLGDKGEMLKLLPGYDIDNYDKYDNSKQYNCWNCCHSINHIYSIPLKCEDNKFYIYGDFCTLGCTLRYIIDNYKNAELWEKYELFFLYYRRVYGEDIDVNIPPCKLCLDFFGGDMSIDEYREETHYNEINNPIIIPVKNVENKKETNSNRKNKGDLKLYRKSNNEKNIFNNMNIN